MARPATNWTDTGTVVTEDPPISLWTPAVTTVEVTTGAPVVVQAVGTLTKQTDKPLAAAITPAGALDFAITQAPFTGALTPAGAVPKVVSKTLGGEFD